VVKRFVAVLMMLSGLLVAGGARAVPVTWTIPNTIFTSFSGGTITTGSISGTFVWDADTTTASNVNVTVTLNGTPTVITSAAPILYTYLIVFANSVSANAPVGFVDYGSLTNAGGTVSGVAVYGGLCSVQGGTCNSSDFGGAMATLTGSAPSAVPTLSEWAQLMLALMAITLVGWHFHRERSY
jgi:hypothetical protein